MRKVIDQMGRSVAVPASPRRIISLVPSQTELLFDLGAGERVVGVTKFCVHPAGARKTAAVIGGTKQFDFAAIGGLQPYLFIGNMAQNDRVGIEQLAASYPVWLSDITTLPDALVMIRAVGELVALPAAADEMAADITARFATLIPSAVPGLRVVYLIWRKPWMAAGNGTFIHEMLQAAGFTNALADRQRYPELTIADFVAIRPDVVLLSSEPYPFRPKHLAEIAALCPGAKIELVDGELFSWYGSRLRLTPAYLTELGRRLG